MAANAPRPAVAQVPARERLATADGLRLDFAPDGVWRRKARRVAATRSALRSQGLFDRLNDTGRRATVAGAPAVSGTLSLPTVLLSFPDTDTLPLPSRAAYDVVLYGETTEDGAPYTLRRYYEELSNGLFSVRGGAVGWVEADVTLEYVVAPCPSSNGLCTTGLRRLTDAFRSVLASIDGETDFGQFDNDGPDGLPNSGDDDGVVDVIQFAQPLIGGECGGNGFWAHKSSFGANDGDAVNGPYATDDPAAGGGFVAVDSYFLTSGVGGSSCEDDTAIMAIGIAAHELGHGLDLPDLYDTSLQSEGAGEWDLMASAMYTSLPSPGHYGAWSKERMGWVTVREITASASVTLGPVLTSDTVLVLRPPVENPRGEYFLVENKQPILADTANLLSGGRAGPKLGGLLVWHVDSTKVEQGLGSNVVNAGSIRGVVVVQADGLNELALPVVSGNRGDAGDPYPGASGNTLLSPTSTPAAVLNAGGAVAGLRLSEIRQLEEGGAMALDIAVGIPNVIRASDTAAVVQVDGVPTARFVGFLDPAATYEIGIDSLQTAADGRRQFEYLSWSDGGGRTHTVTGLLPGDSVVASVATRYRLRVTTTGDGVVRAEPAVDVAVGSFVPAAAEVTLVAEAANGSVLDRWSGDTTATGDTLELRVTEPYDLEAVFLPVLAFGDTLPPPAIAGAPYAYSLRAAGGTGAHRFRLASGSLPAGLALTPAGEIGGIAEALGDFTAEVEVTSGSQRLAAEVRVRSLAPDLPLELVLDELLDLEATLTADEIRYLDLLGNGNGAFDLGDFLAWVERTGLAPPPSARLRDGGRR